MPVVSIIVPVYNVEDYLALTLESVFNQGYQDYELICVNDGSTDRSGELLRRAQEKDSRVRVITKENGGLSSARNAGIKEARGKYVCFLDSDDLLIENACERIVRAFEETNADVVTFGAIPYPEFRGYDWLNEVLSPRDVTYDSFGPELLFGENSNPFVWRTACEAHFLKESGVLFDESLPFGEDQVFHFAIYPRSSKTALISDKLLKYRVNRKGSLMFSRKKSLEGKIADHITIADRILSDWAKAGFLEEYPVEMLQWSTDFIMPELVHLRHEDRKALMPRLKSIWQKFFPEDFLIKSQVNGAIAPLVKVAMEENSGRFAGRNACAAYYRMRDGVASVFAHRVTSVFFGFLHPFRVVARELLPTSSPKKQRAVMERQWDDNEEALRKEATERLLFVK